MKAKNVFFSVDNEKYRLYKNEFMGLKRSKKSCFKNLHFIIHSMKNQKLSVLKNIDLLQKFIFMMNQIFMRWQKNFDGMQEVIKLK